jgi:hypothetical protein
LWPTVLAFSHFTIDTQQLKLSEKLSLRMRQMSSISSFEKLAGILWALSAALSAGFFASHLRAFYAKGKMGVNAEIV